MFNWTENIQRLRTDGVVYVVSILRTTAWIEPRAKQQSGTCNQPSTIGSSKTKVVAFQKASRIHGTLADGRTYIRHHVAVWKAGIVSSEETSQSAKRRSWRILSRGSPRPLLCSRNATTSTHLDLSIVTLYTSSKFADAARRENREIIKLKNFSITYLADSHETDDRKARKLRDRRWNDFPSIPPSLSNHEEK